MNRDRRLLDIKAFNTLFSFLSVEELVLRGQAEFSFDTMGGTAMEIDAFFLK